MHFTCHGRADPLPPENSGIAVRKDEALAAGDDRSAVRPSEVVDGTHTAGSVDAPLHPCEQEQPIAADREADRIRDRQGADPEHSAGSRFDERRVGPVQGVHRGVGDVDGDGLRQVPVGLRGAQG